MKGTFLVIWKPFLSSESNNEARPFILVHICALRPLPPLYPCQDLLLPSPTFDFFLFFTLFWFIPGIASPWQFPFTTLLGPTLCVACLKPLPLAPLFISTYPENFPSIAVPHCSSRNYSLRQLAWPLSPILPFNFVLSVTSSTHSHHQHLILINY